MQWFGATWSEVGGIAISTLAIYVTVVAGLRVAGRRTLSQMSAFDFVVTIAIGSLVAATALNPDPSYGRGLVALVVLLASQQAVAMVRKRFPATRRLFDFAPEHLYREGRLELRTNPFTAQVTADELYSKLRRQGVKSLDDVTLVILEPDGQISLLRSGDPVDLWGTET